MWKQRWFCFFPHLKSECLCTAFCLGVSVGQFVNWQCGQFDPVPSPSLHLEGRFGCITTGALGLPLPTKVGCSYSGFFSKHVIWIIFLLYVVLQRQHPSSLLQEVFMSGLSQLPSTPKKQLLWYLIHPEMLLTWRERACGAAHSQFVFPVSHAFIHLHINVCHDWWGWVLLLVLVTQVACFLTV